MNFKEWLLSEEIFPNKTATVYHRTCQNCDEDKSVKSVSSILTSDFKAGDGCMYGCGLYTTFAIESQFTNYMKTYGKAVVKFKATDLDKYLIFQLSVAKQIHGNDYKISDQFKKLGLLNKPNVNEIKLKEYDEKQEKENYSSVLAKEFYEQNDWIVNSVKGIIYYGKNDGYCLLKYPTVQDGTITMLGYAVAEHDDMKKMEELKNNDGWIKSVGLLDTPIKSVYKYLQSKNKEKFAIVDKEKKEIENLKYIFLTSKNLEKTAQKLAPELNKLSDSNVSYLLKNASDKDEMAEVIAKYKTELSDENVKYLIQIVTDKDKIIKLIIENKPELSGEVVKNLLYFSTERDRVIKLIIEKKTELGDEGIYLLFSFTTDIEKIAESLGEKNISKLSTYFIRQLIKSQDDKPKIAQIINKYHKNKTPEIQELIDKYLETQTIAAK